MNLATLRRPLDQSPHHRHRLRFRFLGPQQMNQIKDKFKGLRLKVKFETQDWDGTKTIHKKEIKDKELFIHLLCFDLRYVFILRLKNWFLCTKARFPSIKFDIVEKTRQRFVLLVVHVNIWISLQSGNKIPPQRKHIQDFNCEITPIYVPLNWWNRIISLVSFGGNALKRCWDFKYTNCWRGFK